MGTSSKRALNVESIAKHPNQQLKRADDFYDLSLSCELLWISCGNQDGPCAAWIFVSSSFCAPCFSQSNQASEESKPQKILIDTDIGSDIDDAFAVGLALESPEFKILGISSATGDTTLRARLLSRLLQDTGRADITSLSVLPSPT